MKRVLCVLLILLLALSLGACGSARPTSSGAEGTTSAAISDAKVEVSALDGSIPTPSLSEEEMITMWKAVIEETSKNDLTQKEALAKVTAPSSLELLKACGYELLDLELPNTGNWWKVQPLQGDWMALYQTMTKGLRDTESKNCYYLLNWKIVKEISFQGDRVEFFIGGRGFGSQTDYFYVYYLPSDDIKGCIGYSNLKYEERDGGWFARADGDDTVFYQQLDEHLYFVAEHF